MNKLICATEEKAPCVVDRSFPEALVETDTNNFAPRRGIAVNDPLGAVYQYNLTIEGEAAKDVVYAGRRGR